MRYLTLVIVAASWGIIGYKIGQTDGIVEGRNTALKTNPVSEELERTCFTLWVGEQAKKAWKKENEK